MPSTIRSNLPGSMSSGVAADSVPGRLFDATSSGDARSLIGNRTIVPSRLIKSAVGLVQTIDTRWPAIKSLVVKSEPYEAPSTSTSFATAILRSRLVDAQPECPRRSGRRACGELLQYVLRTAAIGTPPSVSPTA